MIIAWNSHEIVYNSHGYRVFSSCDIRMLVFRLFFMRRIRTNLMQIHASKFSLCILTYTLGTHSVQPNGYNLSVATCQSHINALLHHSQICDQMLFILQRSSPSHGSRQQFITCSMNTPHFLMILILIEYLSKKLN